MIPASLERIAVRRLAALNASTKLGDLAAGQGNRLEKLKGDLAGFWSIRINDQYRVVFRWTDPNSADDVKIDDYH